MNNTFKSSPVRNFYKNKCVFLTGGTGFVGQVLLEKLLRCTEISKIYILIRNKKGISYKKRFESMCNGVFFETLKSQQPYFVKRIEAIPGDITQSNFGLDSVQLKILHESINIVFHCAASVRFDNPLKTALTINVGGTQNLIHFCDEIKDLVALVYVSTVFSNCNKIEIKEEIIEPSAGIANVVKFMDSEIINKTQDVLIDGFQNTYTFSKHIAEHIVKQEASHLNVGIYRTPIVLPTNEDPISGWTNSYSGPIGLFYGGAMGILRVFPIKKDSHFQAAPADMVVNGLLAAAYEISQQSNQENIPVYNFIQHPNNPMNLYNSTKQWIEIAKSMPFLSSYWFYTMRIFGNKLFVNLLHFLMHLIPGFLVDFWMFLTGKSFRILPTYNKIWKLMNYFPYFYNRKWIWHGNNVTNMWNNLDPEDKKWLPFDMAKWNIDEFMLKVHCGMRRFLAKEDDSTVTRALERQKRLFYLHYTIIIIKDGTLSFLLIRWIRNRFF